MLHSKPRFTGVTVNLCSFLYGSGTAAFISPELRISDLLKSTTDSLFAFGYNMFTHDWLHGSFHSMAIMARTDPIRKLNPMRWLADGFDS